MSNSWKIGGPKKLAQVFVRAKWKARDLQFQQKTWPSTWNLHGSKRERQGERKKRRKQEIQKKERKGGREKQNGYLGMPSFLVHSQKREGLDLVRVYLSFSYKWSNKHFYMCCGKDNTHGTIGIKHLVLSKHLVDYNG